MIFQSMTIGIDLGTKNILVYTKEKGIVFNEPAVVAVDRRTQHVKAIGKEASIMVGKTSQNIETIRPLKDGVIADFDITVQMLKIIFKRISKELGKAMRKPTVIVCAPTGSTAVEKRAIENAIEAYGAKKVHIIEEPVAAALGAGLPIEKPISHMIVDIGGGTTEVALISYGGVVTSRSLRLAGDAMDETIIHYVKENFNVLLGEQTAEIIKQTIGYAPIEHTEETMDVRGRDLLTGLPKHVTLSSYDVKRALVDTFDSILLTIHQTIEQAPPELSGDLVEQGITLTGGGALTNGIKPWLESHLHVPVTIADSPLEAIAIGTREAIKQIQIVKKLG